MPLTPAIAAMMARCAAELGGPDILVNNAGMQFVSPIADFPAAKWDAIIALNLTAVFHTTRAALPAMRAIKWGRIINTASAHSLVASPNKSAYVAAKHGIAGFTKSIALETARDGITANCISPGYVWTPLVEAQIPDTMRTRGLTRDQVINDVLLAAQPTKQFVTPEQVAALAVFLLSGRLGTGGTASASEREELIRRPPSGRACPDPRRVAWAHRACPAASCARGPTSAPARIAAGRGR